MSVNAPGSPGVAGLDTHLAPTMTIGTGFFGRSSLTENLQPRDLVQWTRIAYAADPGEPFGRLRRARAVVGASPARAAGRRAGCRGPSGRAGRGGDRRGRVARESSAG